MEILPTALHPLPTRWITVLGPGSARSAASREFNVCTGFLSIAEVKKVFDAYREVIGESCPERLGLRRQVLIAASDAEAAEINAKAVADFRAEIARGMGKRQTVVPDAPGHSPLDFMFGADEQIIGSPASVAEQIIEQCRATGAGHLLAFVFGTVGRPEIETNYRLWREVIPVLRKAGIE